MNRTDLNYRTKMYIVTKKTHHKCTNNYSSPYLKVQISLNKEKTSPLKEECMEDVESAPLNYLISSAKHNLI